MSPIDNVGLCAAQQQEHLLLQISKACSRQVKQLQLRQRLQLAPPDTVDQARATAAEAEAALAAPRQAENAAVQRGGLAGPEPS